MCELEFLFLEVRQRCVLFLTFMPTKIFGNKLERPPWIRIVLRLAKPLSKGNDSPKNYERNNRYVDSGISGVRGDNL